MNDEYLRLGASLYVPATRPDLVAIANGERFGELRSVIFCTEDAVASGQLEFALENLEQALAKFEPSAMLRFVRVRNPYVMARLLAAGGIEKLHGFVLPKSTSDNLPAYLELLSHNDRCWLMPTLETAEAFDTRAMRRLRALLDRSDVRPRILALRIGGNDLLNLLGLRRGRGATIYDTALGPTIASLATVFKPAGFALTAPVFEGLRDQATLVREVQRDLDHGLFSKSAIHPQQVRWIESQYAVSPADVETAQAVLCEHAPAVFCLHDAMCEPATHSDWARLTLRRARLFGERKHHSNSAEP